jgi:TetR/AcrR family transcriptional regulator, cholesterol catabolism regulator
MLKINVNERSEGKLVEVQTNIKNKNLVSKRRQQIIDAASKLFFEKGFDQTTMREISRASGLTMGSLYDYVRSKDDILVLVYKDVVQRFRVSLVGDENEDWEADPANLEVMLRRIMVQMYKLSKAVQLLYRESWTRRKDVHHQMREIDRQYVERFRQLLLKGHGKGNFQLNNPAATADMILVLTALPALREWSLTPLKSEEVIDTVVDFILKGLAFNRQAPSAQETKVKGRRPIG